MKKLIFLLSLPVLFLCGTCGGGEDAPLTQSQLDSLIMGEERLPSLNQEPVTTIDMGGIEDDPVTTVQVETVNDRQKITLWLPEIEHGPHIGKLTLDVTLAADTVQSYSLRATSAKPTPSKVVDPPSNKSVVQEKIRLNDTKYAIGKRLGVPASSILNKEPLKVGEVIRVKN